MKLKLAFDPDLVALMQAEIAVGEKAVCAAMRHAGRSLKSAWRGRITLFEGERRSGLRLRFIYRRRGHSLLVADGRLNSNGRAVASKSKTGRGVATVPIFLPVS